MAGAKNYDLELKDLIEAVLREQASDLHISVARHPTMRVAGKLTPLEKKPVLVSEDTKGLVFAMLDEKAREKFIEDKELDFSYTYQEKARFRVNAFFERGFIAAALRLVPMDIKSLQELNLPESLLEFARKKQGFFLVVGPTGHGKSTTLASLVNFINHERFEHILTIEDPIEFLFTQDKSIIDQREVGFDTKGFHKALRSMFRQDVNVGMIGEMRDHETISAAVTAAETGHLILSSLHTNNAAQTIDRIIDAFPSTQQNQIRSQLSMSLLGIFSQRLVPRISGGLIPAYELLIANTAVRNLIRENKAHEIDIVIETSSELGMITLNKSLAALVERREITLETALAYSLDQRGLGHLLGKKI
ncbi:MAG: twitching motility protein [Candidatus Giovannonibacteria bacterium GW2011_GWB1_45_9b]|uniref:Type IV pili twitching motility protein PilT n=6 Tax=Candidatus Giovannoniibacteriota TaxID=1752738 RepID=A0A1F5X1C4_9BACT|nr:MAG: twitching motility protein [Candidatus Giovannonibacteria bacterium GW2011_GWC2_44_8]KKU05108.1 MAG: twitching motility protein [Candidatus Giovannonibacteria bacterium GW2011_GWA2_45_21]KKU16514.1 MAG: twitching motility protein [Candidatus Giovannonibacteria bacterium GW2011_GWB1_45_9b]OGF74221.1 MAG: type IV pili twitching motility protein PilT [Candidatus Giovannonibacteria bacterium RIFCSPHIGHO2_02_43_16]OGF81692.1 MAG: type IV pili twitching motility protein PilT [Candidatus Giova